MSEDRILDTQLVLNRPADATDLVANNRFPAIPAEPGGFDLHPVGVIDTDERSSIPEQRARSPFVVIGQLAHSPVRHRLIGKGRRMYH